jgi:hypothetical protein
MPNQLLGVQLHTVAISGITLTTRSQNGFLMLTCASACFRQSENRGSVFVVWVPTESEGGRAPEGRKQVPPVSLRSGVGMTRLLLGRDFRLG